MNNVSFPLDRNFMSTKHNMSSTLRFHMNINGEQSPEEYVRAVECHLAGMPFLIECSIHAHQTDRYLKHNLDTFLRLLKNIRFGVGRNVPAVYLYLPIRKSLTNLEEVIDKHNNINMFLHICTIITKDDSWAGYSGILKENCKLSSRCGIQYSIAYMADNLLGFHPVLKNYRRISGEFFDIGNAIWFHLDDPCPDQGEVLWPLLDSLPYLTESFQHVPLMPRGIMDVFYCFDAIRRGCEPESNIAAKITPEKLIASCQLLRSGDRIYSNIHGDFKWCSVEMKYRNVARFCIKHSDVIAKNTSSKSDMIKVRSCMADFA